MSETTATIYSFHDVLERTTKAAALLQAKAPAIAELLGRHKCVMMDGGEIQCNGRSLRITMDVRVREGVAAEQEHKSFALAAAARKELQELCTDFGCVTDFPNYAFTNLINDGFTLAFSFNAP